MTYLTFAFAAIAAFPPWGKAAIAAKAKSLWYRKSSGASALGADKLWTQYKVTS
jgi:hypothetical protein